MAAFGEFLKPFDFKDCLIIYPATAALISKQFNGVKFDRALQDFEGFPIGQITNVPDRS
ncbi:MAG: hypothetical protein ABIP75_01475 [Pyrinomonadaceae bacterium]